MIGNYPLHLMVLVLLWGYIYTSWSLMGRLGMVSFGHGAFMGIGAYTVVMLWNHFGVSPWIGAPVALALAAVVALIIAYPCFRFRIVGHYFALVTLALSEVTRLVITALRDQTGGSLGATPNGALTEGTTAALGALQFSSKGLWLAIVAAFWLAGLWVWRAVDRGMGRLALQAISEDE
jgi:branched-chain amino acid transport system permease protein